MAKVKARKDAVSTTASKNIEAWLRSMPGVTVYQAHARFISAREIAVGAERISADKVFIDVGGRAIIPAIPGLDAVPYLTSTSILELDAVPEHLIVLGGSYIGLEFAQIFRRFGARVTVIEGAPRLVVREDEDVSDAIRDILEREQIDIELQVDVHTRRKDGRWGTCCDRSPDGTKGDRGLAPSPCRWPPPEHR